MNNIDQILAMVQLNYYLSICVTSIIDIQHRDKNLIWESNEKIVFIGEIGSESLSYVSLLAFGWFLYKIYARFLT